MMLMGNFSFRLVVDFRKAPTVMSKEFVLIDCHLSPAVKYAIIAILSFSKPSYSYERVQNWQLRPLA